MHFAVNAASNVLWFTLETKLSIISWIAFYKSYDMLSDKKKVHYCDENHFKKQKKWILILLKGVCEARC